MLIIDHNKKNKNKKAFEKKNDHHEHSDQSIAKNQ